MIRDHVYHYDTAENQQNICTCGGYRTEHEMLDERSLIMSKHTEGPWEASKDLNGDGVNVYARNARKMLYTIAVCNYMGTADPEPARANARLIAAAPEMLAACEQMLKELNSHGITCSKWDAVIAKAKGEGQ